VLVVLGYRRWSMSGEGTHRIYAPLDRVA
jgi:hypothetical protein